MLHGTWNAPGMHGIWKRLRADDTWNAWYLECMVHGTWNACCMVPGMHGIWNAGCEAPRMNGNV